MNALEKAIVVLRYLDQGGTSVVWPESGHTLVMMEDHSVAVQCFDDSGAPTDHYLNPDFTLSHFVSGCDKFSEAQMVAMTGSLALTKINQENAARRRAIREQQPS